MMPVSARNKHIPTTLRNRVLRARDSIVADLSHKSSSTRTESSLTPSSLDRLPIIAPHVFFTTKDTAFRSLMRSDQNYSSSECRPWQILRIPTTRLRRTVVARRGSLTDIVWYSSVTVSLVKWRGEIESLFKSVNPPSVYGCNCLCTHTYALYHCASI